MNWRSKSFLGAPEGAMARSFYKSMGYTDADLEKPVIAVVNTWNTVCPGQYNLRSVAEAVKEGIRAAGGMPVEFGTIGPCDGIAQGHEGMHYILPSREIIAASIELMVEAHRLDGMVLLGSCDKVVPGLLMAAARLNLPTILVNGGPMYPGEYRGRHISGNEVHIALGALRAGKISSEEFKEIENCACPTPGSCTMMGTANTMCCLAEALGLSLPGSATIPAIASQRLQVAQEAGRRSVDLVLKGIRARDIITKESLENAIRVGLAIGGSTNFVLHLLALAHEAGIDLSIDDFDRLSQETPYIASLMTASEYDMIDFHQAGGVPAVMNQLLPLLHGACLTVNGKTVAENVQGVKIKNSEVIRTLDNPFLPTGGLAVLKGNLAPLSAICKPAAIKKERWYVRGRAKVFNSEEELVQAIHAGRIQRGDMLVVRYEGPKGGPGMREMYTAMEMLAGYELAEYVYVLTDGRFSGSNFGGFVGHISPEAAEGGPLALVEDGDLITVDIPHRTLTLEVSQEELERRKQAWRKPAPKIRSGFLGLYAQLVKSAHYGAVLGF
ncbi:dihydroxyacid dehydratase [Thermanaeromonas toyohensis ToBE]|uniref:Dihydroxy-acid dehydratase n=1 Tax=Thermanaeromonas toyohensis ToBE TaxID=698762 RepID=A0A1W1W066_9FIRM|nr:dihydroxy-acid dehydratase [Thermanaeromonas toyohensis]SMB98995.1 dihydroxyacid dehydratase [Thermanaeromonas toyohensis ToBE]